MIETMFGALYGLVSSPHIMGLMLLAVIFGLLVGVTPGIGGKLSIAMAIPFVFGMEMIAGAVFLLTMHAVNGTSGQISSIMFGVPGDGDDAATTLDGYPLAKKGQAGARARRQHHRVRRRRHHRRRRFRADDPDPGAGGAGSSARPNFSCIALLGITFIAFLSSGDKIVKGLIVGFYGLILATVGMDPQTGTPRYRRRHAVPVGRRQPGDRRARAFRRAGNDRARLQGRLDLRSADGGQELFLPPARVRRDGSAAPLVAGASAPRSSAPSSA